ncbi:MAG: hypothetical protein IKO40_04170 [Kiritimatiellae bacterium]|nr:hypothetical protein [Kiritimatiellia bacterium]
MDKRLTFLLITILSTFTICAQITDVSQCLDIQLSPSILNDIDPSDCSSSQTAFLGFLKGSVSGDLVAFLRPMSDDLRVGECGVANIDDVTIDMTNNFFAVVMQTGFSNHVLVAYSEVETNGCRNLSATLSSQRGQMTKMSQLALRMAETNGEWKITSWDVED